MGPLSHNAHDHLRQSRYASLACPVLRCHHTSVCCVSSLGGDLQLAPADEVPGHSLPMSSWQGPEAAILLGESCMIRT